MESLCNFELGESKLEEENAAALVNENKSEEAIDHLIIRINKGNW